MASPATARRFNCGDIVLYRTRASEQVLWEVIAIHGSQGQWRYFLKDLCGAIPEELLGAWRVD